MKPLLAACVLLITAFLSHPSEGQRVVVVSGNRVTLSVGSSSGVAVGMTGKLQATQVVQGQEKAFTVAKFRVVAVTATGAAAEITAGHAGEVVPGMTARFDQRVEIAAAASPSSRRADSAVRSAAELKAEADRLFELNDMEGAASRYAELLTKYPSDPRADYASRLLAACRKGIEERGGGLKTTAPEGGVTRTNRSGSDRVPSAQTTEDRGSAAASPGTSLSRLRAELTTAKENGARESAVDLAREILRRSPNDEVAAGVREEERVRAKQQADLVATALGREAFENYWHDYAARWQGDKTLEQERTEILDSVRQKWVMSLQQLKGPANRAKAWSLASQILQFFPEEVSAMTVREAAFDDSVAESTEGVRNLREADIRKAWDNYEKYWGPNERASRKREEMLGAVAPGIVEFSSENLYFFLHSSNCYLEGNQQPIKMEKETRLSPGGWRLKLTCKNPNGFTKDSASLDLSIRPGERRYLRIEASWSGLGVSVSMKEVK